jgi:uncharacterized protein GlcG (DUF336 family)
VLRVNNLISRVSPPARDGLRDGGRWQLVLAIATLLMLTGRYTSAGGFPVLPTAILQSSDVENLIAAAVTRAHRDNATVVVAVSDREGNVLGMFDMTDVRMNSNDVDPINIVANPHMFPFPTTQTERTAIEKARTAAFLSSDQNAFSTRTALTLVADHFPMNVANTPEAPLFGLQFSSLPCGDIQLNGNGLTGALGGIPVYLKHAIAGGIGVDGAAQTEDERIALAAVTKQYSVPAAITADNIYVGGIQLPWIGVTPPGRGHPIPYAMLTPAIGMPNANYPVKPTFPTFFTPATFAGVPGEIRIAITGSSRSDPNKLTATDVTTMITNSIALAKKTRAAIRLPIGVPARMQVGVTDLDGTPLGLFRTNDATMFSLDIVIQKGRTVTVFSDPDEMLGMLGNTLRSDLGVPINADIAFTSRTIGFLAQPFYPPGIDGTPPGPLHNVQQQLFNASSAIFCEPLGDGVTAFPGSTPLYKNGELEGGLGLSGDGVDQDDYITNGGAAGYLPAPAIRCDQIDFRGTPLPFFKFPRHPGL